MNIDQIKRFERWRRRLPENTAYFVGLILDQVVPKFEAQGFGRFHDYAGGSTFAVGPNCIPLQRRRGSEWPTAEILFHKRSAPLLGVHFAVLPEICHRWDMPEHRWQEISRADASVVEGPALFSLCKGTKRNFDCNFGFRWWSLRPKRKLQKEVDILTSLLPGLFSLFDRGIPSTWLAQPAGYVDRHTFMQRSPRLIGP